MWFAFTSLHLCMSWLYWKRSALVSLWFYMSKYLSFNTWPHSMGEQSPRSKGWSLVGASSETPGEQSEVKSLSSICAQNYCLQCCWWSEHARKCQCPQISSHLSSYVWLAILAAALPPGPEAILPFCLQLSQLTQWEGLRGSGLWPCVSDLSAHPPQEPLLSAWEPSNFLLLLLSSLSHSAVEDSRP